MATKKKVVKKTIKKIPRVAKVPAIPKLRPCGRTVEDIEWPDFNCMTFPFFDNFLI